MLFAHAYDGDGAFTASRLELRGRSLRILGAPLSFRGRFDVAGETIAGTWSTPDGATPVMDVVLALSGRKV